jgi:hypothetical protein
MSFAGRRKDSGLNCISRSVLQIFTSYCELGTGKCLFPNVIRMSRGLEKPWGFQEVEALRFQNSRHIKVFRLSALRTGRLYPPGNIPGTHFCYRLSQLQGHSAIGRIISMKNSSDTVGNRTLPACNAVSQTTAPPHCHTNQGSALYFPPFLGTLVNYRS